MSVVVLTFTPFVTLSSWTVIPLALRPPAVERCFTALLGTFLLYLLLSRTPVLVRKGCKYQFSVESVEMR